MRLKRVVTIVIVVLAAGVLWRVGVERRAVQPVEKADASLAMELPHADAVPGTEGENTVPSPVPSVVATPVAEEDSVAGRAAEDLRDEIADLEADIEAHNVIARLNSGDISQAERDQWGQVFQRIVKLKAQILAAELAQIEEETTALEAGARARRGEGE